jgi:hypothetical protein
MASTQQPERLGYNDRFQLAWALSWPCAVFGLLYWLVRGLLGYRDNTSPR